MYFFPPNCTPIPPLIKAGVRFSKTQSGFHVSLPRGALQSVLWRVQWDFWQSEPQY